MMQRIPILEFDGDKPAILEPGGLIARNAAMPERCVVCFFQDAIDLMLGVGRISEIACLKSEMGRHPVFLIKDTDPKVALLHPGVGAPLAAALLEETIALGGRKFIACGGAGTLDSQALGRLIVPTSAIRDEGTSCHYLPPGDEVGPTPAALGAVEQALKAADVPFEKTKTWTTDAVYRETRGKAALRRGSGYGCVEMEAAALFAVARFRAVELAQILYAGDDLGGEFWDSRNWDGDLGTRERLLQLGIAACGLI
jgi:nucleoside phosphorylase